MNGISMDLILYAAEDAPADATEVVFNAEEDLVEYYNEMGMLIMYKSYIDSE